MKKIVICGGHLTPAQSLIEVLGKREDLRIYFFGRKFVTQGSKSISTEYKQISKDKVTFKNITAGRLPRHFSKYAPLSLLKIPIGFVQTFCYLVLIRPSLVISFGGSLSFPTIFSAWLLGIDTVTHEQAAVPTISNQLNSLFVKKIYVSWPATQAYFPKEKTVVIGNLVRSSLIAGLGQSIKPAKRNTIFITGGNQGSHFLNWFVFENIKNLKTWEIIHQVGASNFKNDHEKAAAIKQKNYHWFEFIGPLELKKIFEESQIIIARAGANTVWELALFGKVAILIPLPHSAGSEQQKNAQILKDAGSAIVIKQAEASPAVIQDAIVQAQKNYPSMQKSAASFAKTMSYNGSQLLADDICSILKS